MNIFIKLYGVLVDKFKGLYSFYKEQKINTLLGGHRIVRYPYNIQGVNNIQSEDHISIGVGSTIFTTRANLIIQQHFVSGPGLTIITGDHMPVIGRFLDTITDEDKDRIDINHAFDQDVNIEEDVWCGANVTILKGVTIGRGSIIAAGAVVTRDIPRYSIAGGAPAKVIKRRLTDNEIAQHESKLYPTELNK